MLYQDNKPSKVTSVVISTQHSKDLNQEKVKDLIIPYIKKSIPEKYIKDLDSKEIYINPTGQFIIGGPDGDTGLTGRKIIVDTYGGAAPHGGGAFSGKDPTKVDRSAAYAARYLAKKYCICRSFKKMFNSTRLCYRSFKTFIYFYKTCMKEMKIK